MRIERSSYFHLQIITPLATDQRATVPFAQIQACAETGVAYWSVNIRTHGTYLAEEGGMRVVGRFGQAHTRTAWQQKGDGYPLKLLLLALVYFAAAKLSLHLALPPGFASPVWPPSAIALYAALIWGVQMLPAVCVAAALASWSSGLAVVPAFAIGIGNTLEACIGMFLFQRFVCKQPHAACHDRTVLGIAIAALSSMVAATIGTATLATVGRHADNMTGMQWLTWWLGDTTGIVIVLPFLLFMRKPSGNWKLARKIEAGALALLLPTIAYLSFSSTWGPLLLGLAPLPFLIWAAIRFGLQVTVWGTVALCGIGLWQTLQARSPFWTGVLNTSLLMLMAYVSVVGTIGIVLAGLIRQREKAEARLQRERDELERHVQQKTEHLLDDLEERKRIELQLAEAQELAQVGSWELDLATGKVTWSDQLYRIYGRDRDSFQTTLENCRQLIHPDDRDALAAAVEQCRATGDSIQLTHRILLPNGDVRIVAARAQIATRAGSDAQCLIGTLQDITEARQIEQAQREAEERYRLVVELSPDAIVVQQDARVVFANRAARELLGAGHADDLVGRSIFDLIHPAFHALTVQRMQGLQSGDTPPTVEEKFLRIDGGVVDVELNASPFNYLGRPASLVVMRDISERKSTLEQMARLAHYDSLTGLPNRTLFHQRLEHALSVAERPGQSLEILFLDLDRFKQINDTLGHDTGDLVLKETAHRLCHILRESDTVARLGGDEFVVLVENVDEPHRAGVIAEKILAAFREPFLQEPEPLVITTSIGIASYPNDGMDAQTLLKNADVAMYRAKELGRNNYRYYSPEMNRHTAERLSLESALAQALDHEQLSLYYQPKIDIASNRMTGMEALLRWRHPTLGLIRPHQFIQIAEETGMIQSIGYWVIRTACRQNRLWQDSGEERLKVAVNLSLRQFSDDSLADNVRRILEETGLAAEYLELEVSESALMANPDKAMRTMAVLNAIGVSVAIDDFGVGYSSLAYLKQFPIHVVKIDRSFVQGIPLNRSDAAVAKAIISLAHSLECSVVAEGTETQQQFEFLREHDCDSVQGNYFSEPMSAELFGDLLKSGAKPYLH
jgi:diguanylate cyclase (GGDEF)-like protein/PAS domain S-box-containing protein